MWATPSVDHSAVSETALTAGRQHVRNWLRKLLAWLNGKRAIPIAEPEPSVGPPEYSPCNCPICAPKPVQVLQLGPVAVFDPSRELIEEAIRMNALMEGQRSRLVFEERLRWH